MRLVTVLACGFRSGSARWLAGNKKRCDRSRTFLRGEESLSGPEEAAAESSEAGEAGAEQGE